MAKTKTTWTWRGFQYGSKEDLLAYVRARVREKLISELRVPVDEKRGKELVLHGLNFKLQVSLGDWPPKNKRSTRPIPKGTPVKRSPKVELKDAEDYFK